MANSAAKFRRADPLVAQIQGALDMSEIRVLVGTRKGDFILTANGKRETSDVMRSEGAGG